MSTTTVTRPEPVAKAGAIAGAVAAVILAIGGLLRVVGWLSDDVDVDELAVQASNLVLGLAAIWATVGPLVLAWRARDKVTPLEAPQDTDGTPLTPVSTYDLGRIARLLIQQAEAHAPGSLPVILAVPDEKPADVDQADVEPPVDIGALRREYHLDP